MRRLVVLAVTVLVVALASLLLPGVASAWSWPVDGAVLRPFTLGADPYAGGQHRGIDVAGVDGGPVRAPAGGSITFAGTVPTHGRTVAILTADGYSVTVAHLGAIEVAKGQAVDEGAVIGTLGNSGTPEHAQAYVHLGVRVVTQEQGYVDPAGFLPAAAVEPVSGPEPAPAEAPAMEQGPAAAPPPPTEAPAPAATQATQGPDPVAVSQPASASQAGQAGLDPAPAAEQPPAAPVATASAPVATPAPEPVRTEPAQPSLVSAPSGIGRSADAALEVETAAPMTPIAPTETAAPAGERAIPVSAARPRPSSLPIAVVGRRPERMGGNAVSFDPMSQRSERETAVALPATRAELDRPSADRPPVGLSEPKTTEPVTAPGLDREVSGPVAGVASRPAAVTRFADGRFTDRDSPNWSVVAACVALILLLTTAGAVVRRAPVPSRPIDRHDPCSVARW